MKKISYISPSGNIFIKTLAQRVEVEHPYEPVLCNRVCADKVVIVFGKRDDYKEKILSYLLGNRSYQSLKDNGIYLVSLFYDKGLFNSATIDHIKYLLENRSSYEINRVIAEIGDAYEE